MHIHIALYAWKPDVTEAQIIDALSGIEALTPQIPDIIEIATGVNTSPYGEGYTHVILVRGKNQTAIDAYRVHPEHQRLATIIEAMEDRGIGVDFVTNILSAPR